MTVIARLTAALTDAVDLAGVYAFSAVRKDDLAAVLAVVEAAQAWADLCHDYDLNESGGTIMRILRDALARIYEK